MSSGAICYGDNRRAAHASYVSDKGASTLCLKSVLLTAETIREEVILALMRNVRLFPGFPERVDVQSARREFACRLYYHLIRASQDPPLIREYNEEAAREVMQALGHDDLGVVCRHYLRLQHAPADQVTTYDTRTDPADQESTQA